MKPILTIIMTAYNAQPYIREAIKSILSQSFVDFEFIIVDDGSTDESDREIMSFSDPRIRFYKREHNGRANALNYALSLSKCDLIAFMDADDISMPNRLIKQYELLNQNKNIGIVSSWYELIDENGNTLNYIRKLPEHHDEIEYELTIHCSVCFPSSMIRKDLIMPVGGFNELLQTAVDYDLFLRLLSGAVFHNIQEPLLQYRIHSKSISSSYGKEQRNNTLYLANRYLLELLERTNVNAKKIKIYFRLGLNEYYHGSMKTARRWFIQALPKSWMRWEVWRYFIATFMGAKFFSIYRKSAINY